MDSVKIYMITTTGGGEPSSEACYFKARSIQTCEHERVYGAGEFLQVSSGKV